MTAYAPSTSELRTAFDAFSARSLSLEQSYRDLQCQVQRLTSELAASQSDRHHELLEKERLAEQLATTLNALPGAVVVLDASGTITDRNDKAAELLNQPLRGRAWATIVKRECAASRHSDGDLELNDGRVLSLQRRNLGENQGVILLLTDVTESRRLRELLARQQRLTAIGEMSAKLAHQIRTPLASALLYASQLAPTASGKSRAAEQVVTRLRELDRIVNDMLLYAGGVRHADEVIEVALLLEDVADTARSGIANSIGINVCPGSESGKIAGNHTALKGALINLVENAANACEANGKVELSALRNGDRLCLAVTDNGTGIAADQIEHIFEPFFTTRPQGTGLGLAVVRSVAEAHGGEVLVDSDSIGTTVALSLPVTEAAVGADMSLKEVSNG